MISLCNLPTSYQNSLLQYSNCETSQKAWLWFADGHDKTRMKYKADEYANEVGAIMAFSAAFLGISAAFLGISAALHKPQSSLATKEEVLSDLLKFMLKRHAILRLGRRVKLWWE